MYRQSDLIKTMKLRPKPPLLTLLQLPPQVLTLSLSMRPPLQQFKDISQHGVSLFFFQTYESGTMKKSRMGFEDEYHNDKSNNRVINNNHDDNTTTNNNNNDNNNNVQMS